MRFAFPHPLVLLVAAVFLAAGLTWLLPAGQFERRDDPATGRRVVVAGTFHEVARQPVGPFAAVVAIPRGLVLAADIVFFVFLVGGAFSVVDETGALRAAVNALADRLAERGRALVIPLVCGVFALGGALENLQEEIIPLVPILLLLCRRLGFDPITAVAMSIGAASVGSAFSPVNPFQAVIGQKLAGLPPVSAWAFRLAFMLPALAVWTWATWRKAEGGRRKAEGGEKVPASSSVLPSEAGNGVGDLAAGKPREPAPDSPDDASDSLRGPPAPLGPTEDEAGTSPPPLSLPPSAFRLPPSAFRLSLILALVVLAFAAFIFGVVRFGWGFEQMAGVFLVMGVAAGLVGGLGIGGTAEAFVKGFREMAFAAMVIGFARAIFVVLDDGRVVDTLVAGLFAPLGGLPPALAAAGMVGAQTLAHFPVPSVSGQAVLTLPILVPLGDLLGVPRQAVVLTFQYGAGLCELISPTNAALVAILGAAGVRFEQWLRFVLPVYAALLALGLAAVGLAVAVGLG